MKHRLAIGSASLFALVAVSACGDVNASPDRAVAHGFSSLRENNIESLLHTLLTPQEYSELEERWNKERKTPVDPAQAREFEQMMEKLTARGAADKLFAELQPELAAAGQQWSAMVGMLPMFVNSATRDRQPSGTDALVQGLVGQLRSVDIGDEKKLKSALEIVTSCARDLDLDDTDDVQSLDLDDAFEKLGLVLEASKGVLDLYGIEIDQVLESVDVSVLSEADGKASVQVAYDLFGKAQKATVEMIERDGRWTPGP